MRKGALWAGSALAGAALAAGLAIALTGWLLEPSPPVPADLMVVLAGGSGERIGTALDLYRAGMAPAILVTSPQGYPAAEFAWLAAEGVPERALVPPLRPSATTWEDAAAVEQVIRKRPLRSLLVITSPYHCRRARLILRRVLAGHDVEVAVTPSKSLYMTPERWWQERQGWRTVPGEYPKLLWAWLVAGPAEPADYVTGNP